MNQEEAKEIIQKIKNECDSASDTCGGCVFCEMSENGNCPLAGNPQYWEI